MTPQDLRQLEETWKDLTGASNCHFENCDFEAALEGYEKALKHAENLNTHHFICSEEEIPYYHIYIISCNNIATLYKEFNKHDLSEKMHLRSIHYIFYIAENDQINAQTAQNILGRAILFYREFLDETLRNDEPLQSILQKVEKLDYLKMVH